MEIRTIRGVFMIWIGKTGIYEIKSPLFPWNVVLYCMPWILVNCYFLKLCFWTIKNCKFQRNVLMQMKRRRKLLQKFWEKKMQWKIFQIQNLQTDLEAKRMYRFSWKKNHFNDILTLNIVNFRDHLLIIWNTLFNFLTELLMQ